MRFLLDENLSPQLGTLLRAAGHDCVHVRDVGLKSAVDETVLDAAHGDGRVLVRADTDFGAILARRQSSGPSFLLLRRVADRRAAEQARLIPDNLDQVVDDLTAGAIVVFGERSLRVRSLPL